MAKCVFQFFAQMLQTPWVRVDWGLYLRGEQGSMKNFVLDTCSHFLIAWFWRSKPHDDRGNARMVLNNDNLHKLSYLNNL